MKKFRNCRLAVLLAGCLMLTAAPSCPTQTQIHKAASASAIIAPRVDEVTQAVKALYEAHTISLAAKDDIAGKLVVLAKAGGDFNRLVKQYSDQYKNGTLPVNVWSELSANFDKVTKPFLEILDLIPQAAGLKDSKAFRDISAAVVSIANIFLQVGENRFAPVIERSQAYAV